MWYDTLKVEQHIKQERAMSANDAKMAGLNSLGKTYDFGINEGTVGPSVIDVSSLYAQTGQFTYDPGFTSTASCQSSITYIDGEEGTLLHRGYPIEQLAEKGNFVETCYLLLNGQLPSRKTYSFGRNSGRESASRPDVKHCTHCVVPHAHGTGALLSSQSPSPTS